MLALHTGRTPGCPWMATTFHSLTAMNYSHRTCSHTHIHRNTCLCTVVHTQHTDRLMLADDTMHPVKCRPNSQSTYARMYTHTQKQLCVSTPAICYLTRYTQKHTLHQTQAVCRISCVQLSAEAVSVFSCQAIRPHLLPIIKYAFKMSPAPERATAEATNRFTLVVQLTLAWTSAPALPLSPTPSSFFLISCLSHMCSIFYMFLTLCPSVAGPRLVPSSSPAFLFCFFHLQVHRSAHLLPSFHLLTPFSPLLCFLPRANLSEWMRRLHHNSYSVSPPTTTVAALISIFTSFQTYHIDIIKAPSQQRTPSLSSPFYTFPSLSLSLLLFVRVSLFSRTPLSLLICLTHCQRI